LRGLFLIGHTGNRIELANLCPAIALLAPLSSHMVMAVFRQISQRRKAPMSSTLSSSTRSWFSGDPNESSADATLVPADPNVSTGPKNRRLLVGLPLRDKQTLLAIAFPITFCIGIAAGSVWQSTKETIASIPQAAPAPAAPSSNLEHQLEAMSLGLAAVRQNLAELANGLGQVRHDITDVQTAQQALFDKMSEPPPRPAAAPATKPAPRPSQAPLVR
jgi:hypothetical protein